MSGKANFAADGAAVKDGFNLGAVNPPMRNNYTHQILQLTGVRYFFKPLITISFIQQSTCYQWV